METSADVYTVPLSDCMAYTPCKILPFSIIKDECHVRHCKTINISYVLLALPSLHCLLIFLWMLLTSVESILVP